MKLLGIAGVLVLSVTGLLGQSTVDFGTKGNYELLTHRFTLRNASSASVEITAVRSSCACGAATVGEHVIAPGKAGIIDCQLDPLTFEGKVSKSFWVDLKWEKGVKAAKAAEPGAAGDIMLKGGETEIVLRMTGMIRTRVRLSTQDALFTQDGASAEVRLVGEARNATIKNVMLPEKSHFAYGLLSDRRCLRITPKGMLPSGSWVEQWTVEINDEKVKSLTLGVRSLANARIMAIPDVVYVGEKPRRTKILFRSAEKGTAFRISAAYLEPGHVALTPKTKPGGSWAVYLDEVIQTRLADDARVVVTTDLEDSRTIEVPVVKR